MKAPRWSRWRAPAAHLGSGLLLGLAFVHPALWWCAWLGMGLLAVALTWTRSSWAVLGAVLLAQWVMRAVAFPWVPEMNRITFGYTGADAVWILLGEWTIWALPFAVSLAVGHRLLRDRRLVFLWLPIVWALAELVRFHVLSLAIDDWLMTQWTVGPVLKALGHLGWYPTLLLSLFAAAAVGEGLVTGRRRLALSALAVPLVFLVLPSLEPAADRLEGIAAVHTTSLVALPHVPLADDPRVIVWPEGALEHGPILAEGKTPGARVRPIVPGSRATHLSGAITTLPFGGRQNQVLVVDPEGDIVQTRAKALLFPIGERALLGIGQDAFVPGAQPPVLDVAGVAAIPLICGEVMSRSLVARGVEAGGRVLMVPARDQMMIGDRPLRQLLAVQVMRSVEFGVPSVRGSYGGRASFVAADGEVLALSGRTRNGLLTWDPTQGARDTDFWGDPIGPGRPPEHPPPEVAVLYEEASRALRTRCPEGSCAYYALDDFTCPEDAHASTVVVAGHANPPTYLSHSADEVAAAVRCFHPELVVVDVCYGASAQLLDGLADLGAVVVAAPYLLPGDGLDYGLAFFTSPDPVARAAAVQLPGGRPLLRGRVTRAAFDSALAEVAGMDAAALREHMARRVPPSVQVTLPDAGPMLVPFEWSRVAAGKGARAGRMRALERMRSATRP